jgi:hypothetical protein
MNRTNLIIIAVVVVALIFWWMKPPKTSEAPESLNQAQPANSAVLVDELNAVDVGGSLDSDFGDVDAEAAAL